MEAKRILILDDEQEICFLLATLLRQMGYETDHAYNLTDGMHKLNTERAFDLVFLDLNLPDGLGHDLVPVIKAKLANVKVVMISAHDTLLRQIQSDTFGIDHSITKPFDRKSIAKVLADLDL
ncbi:MAG: response regulator [Bacteroidota bacterium]